MNQFVIIEKLKELINGQKVLAGVFYTYNFEVTFFENYLLPVFLPNIPFSDNEIQNKILWRHYAKNLPPVTVYCDFHVKSPNAPSLDYKVIPIDIKRYKDKKPCFHPKVSFILLEDSSLIVLVGSCNLTQAGWCTNKEVVSVVKLENGVNLPHGYKFNLKKFFNAVFDLSYQKHFSDAEVLVDGFLKSSLYTEDGETSIEFYNPFEIHFEKRLKQLWDQNAQILFDQIEIISPYITKGDSIIHKSLEYVKEGKILLTAPYKDLKTVDVTENNFNKIKELGVKWAKFIDPGKEKGFRFNHSKIYRFKGQNQIFTMVGSVNYTEAAWRGVKNYGNVEAGVIYTEPVANWEPWLTPDDNDEIIFAENQGDETGVDDRQDVPNIFFVLDWYEETLSYYLRAAGEVRGKVLLDGDKGTILQKGKKITINLTPEWLENLSQNAIVKIRYNGKIFHFYPEQIGIESRPLDTRLKITDQELLDLWKHISPKDPQKTQISEIIEAYVREKTNKDGDIIEGDSNPKRTMNMMASHISALINLEKTVYEPPVLVREYDAAYDLFHYYLYTHNFDTLKGYREMLQTMHDEGKLLSGFYWLLLEIIKKDFYNKRKNNAFLKSIRIDIRDYKAAHDATVNSLEAELENVKNKLKGEKNFNNKFIQWIKTKLEENVS